MPDKNLTFAKRGALGAPGDEPLPDYMHLSGGQLNLDVSKLEVPALTYDADFMWVRERNGAVSFFFAKEDLDDKAHLASRVEIRCVPEAFVDGFWKFNQSVWEKQKVLVPRLRPAGERRPAEEMPSKKDTSFWANVSIVAQSGSAASLSFFNLPPQGIAFLAQNRVTRFLEVEPILRVLSTAIELHRMLGQCEGLAEKLDSFVHQLSEHT